MIYAIGTVFYINEHLWICIMGYKYKIETKGKNTIRKASEKRQYKRHFLSFLIYMCFCVFVNNGSLFHNLGH